MFFRTTLSARRGRLLTGKTASRGYYLNTQIERVIFAVLVNSITFLFLSEERVEQNNNIQYYYLPYFLIHDY